MFPHQLVYDKTCNLLVEVENKAYWALKLLIFDPSLAEEKTKLQLLELEEMRQNAYKSFKIYKESVKKYHDRKLFKR